MIGAHAIFIGVFLILLDQGSKMVIGAQGAHVLNSGFVLGMGLTSGPWLFLLLLLLLIADARQRGFRLPDIMIIAGGIGNIVDRVTRGAVLDWIRVGTVWFNLGDIWITLGVSWILLSSLRMRRSSS